MKPGGPSAGGKDDAGLRYSSVTFFRPPDSRGRGIEPEKLHERPLNAPDSYPSSRREHMCIRGPPRARNGSPDSFIDGPSRFGN